MPVTRRNFLKGALALAGSGMGGALSVPALMTLAVIPFGSKLGSQQAVIADLNVGILFTFGIVSLSVYGIVLAGYASNSKYPFLGGIRSSAQMISYEIAMGMSVIPVFMLVGDLNLSAVIEYQKNGMWLILKQPIAFVIFLVAAFAETNRLPFDMPEAESELVGGYHTEYSSMKFALFFLGEYAAMIAVRVAASKFTSSTKCTCSLPPPSMRC